MQYWQISHTVLLVAQVVMAATGVITFIVGGRRAVEENGRSSSSSSFGSNNFNISFQSSVDATSAVVLAWTTFAVAIVGLGFNFLPFIAINVLEYRDNNSSWQRTTRRRLSIARGLAIFICVVNCLGGIANGIVVGFLATRVIAFAFLWAPLIASGLASIAAFSTFVCYIKHSKTCKQRLRDEPEEPAKSSYMYSSGWGNQPSYNNQQPQVYRQ